MGMEGPPPADPSESTAVERPLPPDPTESTPSTTTPSRHASSEQEKTSLNAQDPRLAISAGDVAPSSSGHVATDVSSQTTQAIDVQVTMIPDDASLPDVTVLLPAFQMVQNMADVPFPIPSTPRPSRSTRTEAPLIDSMNNDSFINSIFDTQLLREATEDTPVFGRSTRGSPSTSPVERSSDFSPNRIKHMWEQAFKVGRKEQDNSSQFEMDDVTMSSEQQLGESQDIGRLSETPFRILRYSRNYTEMEDVENEQAHRLQRSTGPSRPSSQASDTLTSSTLTELDDSEDQEGSPSTTRMDKDRHNVLGSVATPSHPTSLPPTPSRRIQLKSPIVGQQRFPSPEIPPEPPRRNPSRPRKHVQIVEELEESSEDEEMPELERGLRAAHIDTAPKKSGDATNKGMERETPVKRRLVGRLVAGITEKPSVVVHPPAPVRT
jgi:hypothetical protein